MGQAPQLQLLELSSAENLLNKRIILHFFSTGARALLAARSDS
jgi:hypothetical protein